MDLREMMDKYSEGGVVMRSITNNNRRATRDIELIAKGIIDFYKALSL